VARALVLRHHQEDRPGLVGDALEARGYRLDVVLMDEMSATPSAAGYDLLLILGSKHAVYDEQIEAKWFGRELDVIAEAHRLAIPIFGICFGAQALCRFHGGVVSPSNVPEIGWYEVEEQNDSGIAPGPWFEYHYDECTLPEGARLWATSPRSVQAFSIGRNVGVQFHPEVDDLQLEEWFAADDEDDIRDVGAMHAALVARTKLETPAARLRAVELVDIVLDHFSTWAQTTA
jgi:GMP synthase-like glutamine amidotransferase